MMATLRHVTSSSGLRKFQADGFLLDGLYAERLDVRLLGIHSSLVTFSAVFLWKQPLWLTLLDFCLMRAH